MFPSKGSNYKTIFSTTIIVMVRTDNNDSYDEDNQNDYENKCKNDQNHIVIVLMEFAIEECPPSRGRSSKSQQHLHLGTVKILKGFTLGLRV